MYFNLVYLVLGLASAVYAMPFVATTTTTPTPQNSQPQLIARANSRSSLIAKIAFTGPPRRTRYIRSPHPSTDSQSPHQKKQRNTE
ncbi:hypothetical protein EV359DRAFT_87247 [Lentinula novae-zelandiae]|nr:hypothetical protein EV359DRAFT_87247 [Lentinula novae-zelandiae]